MSPAGPDMSTFAERDPVELRAEAAEVGIQAMKKNGSVGSQLWTWAHSSPPHSPNSSVHGGNFWSWAAGRKSQSDSRESSVHGGSAASPSPTREGSLRGGKMWDWAKGRPSPAPSREGSVSGGNAFANDFEGGTLPKRPSLLARMGMMGMGTDKSAEPPARDMTGPDRSLRPPYPRPRPAHAHSLFAC